MSTIFSKIINGEIQCYKVAENFEYLAFLDIRPFMLGHTLVIPKKEVDYLFDLDNETYNGLLLFSKKVAVAIKKVVPCIRIGVLVLGMEIPHAHIHLIPLENETDILFPNRKNFSQEEMRITAEKIFNAVKL